MIHSLFLINAAGDIFLEKHWKSAVSRSVCDYFFEAQERASEAENVPPVIATPHHCLLSVYRHKIFFVAVIQSEVPPLFVIEFLHRVVDTFQVRPGGGGEGRGCFAPFAASRRPSCASRGLPRVRRARGVGRGRPGRIRRQPARPRGSRELRCCFAVSRLRGAAERDRAGLLGKELVQLRCSRQSVAARPPAYIRWCFSEGSRAP